MRVPPEGYLGAAGQENAPASPGAAFPAPSGEPGVWVGKWLNHQQFQSTQAVRHSPSGRQMAAPFLQVRRSGGRYWAWRSANAASKLSTKTKPMPRVNAPAVSAA